jgi:hypothetical protein
VRRRLDWTMVFAIPLYWAAWIKYAAHEDDAERAVRSGKGPAEDSQVNVTSLRSGT